MRIIDKYIQNMLRKFLIQSVQCSSPAQRSNLLGKLLRIPFDIFPRHLSSTSLPTLISQQNYQHIRTYSAGSDHYRMRFVQFQGKNDSKVRIGVVSDDGECLTDITSTSCYPSDMIGFIKANVSLDDIQQKVVSGSKIPTSDVRLLAPVSNPEKIVCIGLNYKGHCEEQNKVPPSEPMFFSKYASAIVGPTDNVLLHKITKELDWEVELAVIIGKEAKHVTRENAFDYIFGYSVAQDISARDWQKTKNGGQFLIGKSMDTFCPLGPAIVHKTLISNPHNLSIKCSLNGVQKQCGNTNELIFRIDDIIARLTQCITLKPGDVILTGTPAGVGMHRKPPEFLKDGDLIESEIEGIGKLMNKVVAEH